MLVNSTETYVRLKEDPTECIQRMSNQLVKELYDQRMINAKEKASLSKYNRIRSSIYGNPKIHKENLPIVSCVKDS